MEEGAGALAVLLPAVDAAPMHDHRRPGDAGRDLQTADERLALERNLHDRQRRPVMRRRLAEQAQRVPVGLLLPRRVGDGIAADMAIFEREGVELGKLFAGCARVRPRVGLGLVGEPDLAPCGRPVVAVEAGERIDDLLGVIAPDALERVDMSGAPENLLLDLVERALLRGRARRMPADVKRSKLRFCACSIRKTGSTFPDMRKAPRGVHVGWFPTLLLCRDDADRGGTKSDAPVPSRRWRGPITGPSILRGPRIACGAPDRTLAAPYPTGREAERSELKRAFCSSLSPS